MEGYQMNEEKFLEYVKEILTGLRKVSKANGGHVDECTFWIIDHRTFQNIRQLPRAATYIEYTSPSIIRLVGYPINTVAHWRASEMEPMGPVDVIPTEPERVSFCLSLQTVIEATRRVVYIDSSLTDDFWKVKQTG